MLSTPFENPEIRRRAVAMAVSLTTGTTLAPQRYERRLLALYQRGILTIEEVMELLNLGVFQVLYHSRATAPPTAAQLEDLLAWSQLYNAAHQITGLLLYSDGRYVQVLEGAEADVRALYARIQLDARHEQVTTVSAGPGPQRLFADWRMGFGYVTAPTIDQVLAAVQAPDSVLELTVEDPHLQVLLHAFAPSAANAADETYRPLGTSVKPGQR